MPRKGPVRRWLNAVLGVVATLLIVLALVVGAVRLLLPLAPEYQADIRRIATEATGLDVAFTGVSASWPFAGPELRLTGVRVRLPGDGREVLVADELRVGVSLWQGLLDRRLAPNRVAVRGAPVELLRMPDGAISLNDVPLAELLRRPPQAQLPRLAVRLEDLRVRVRTPGRLVGETRFDVPELAVTLRPQSAEFRGELEPRDGLARRLRVAGTLPRALLPGAPAAAPPPGDWGLAVVGNDLDLAQLLRLGLDLPGPMATGRGDLEVDLRFRGLEPAAASVDLDLADVTLAGSEGPYRSLLLAAGWEQRADGWELALDRLVLRRGDRSPPPSRATARFTGRDGDGVLDVAAERLRLGDVYALVRAVAAPSLREAYLPTAVRGELRDVTATVTLAAGKPPAYTATAAARDLGFVMPAGGAAVTGITGRVRATEGGGALELAAGEALVQLPALFRQPIRLTRATGRVGWRLPATGPVVIAEDLVLTTADAEGRGRVQVGFPAEGSPLVDVVARFRADSIPTAREYLPLVRFRPTAVAWLDRALVAGRVPAVALRWQGPLRGFPYADGGGQFRAEFELADAVLDYAPDWPRLEEVAARVVIDRATLASTENRGRLAGVLLEDAQVRVTDLARDAVVEVESSDPVTVPGILAFLRGSPIAGLLGPTLANVTGAGKVAADVRLRVPVAAPQDYTVTGDFVAQGARLGLRGLDFGLTDLAGAIRLDGATLTGDGLRGRFLDEPVQVALRPATADEAGVSHVATLTGETPVPKLAAAFSLPFPDRLGGRMAWTATARVPTRAPDSQLTIRVASDLADVTTTLAEPLAKAAGAADPLDLEVRFPDRDSFRVAGTLGRGLGFALRFAGRADGGYDLERGELARGTARLPASPGLVIRGDFPALRFEDWFVAGAAASEGPAARLRRLDLRAARFGIFGELFRDVRIDATRAGADWTVRLASERVTGTVRVPGADDEPIDAELERLWFVEDDPAAGGDGQADPRALPPVRLQVADFVLGDMRFGRLAAQVSQRGDGVAVEPLTLTAPSFTITGNALWVVEEGDVARQRTELKLGLRSTDIRATLTDLGYDPVLEGRAASGDADLVWAGGPRGDFLQVAGGRLTVGLERGQFLGVEPGSGRLLGLLSVTALPRRLGLDFRDVTDKGLAFDAVKGEFRLDAGNAFTCNLGLTGPVADLGIVGRVGFRAEDYEQIAVVRPHVGDVVALGSAVVGGPVVGGAAILIAQVFRKPLSSLGESYYRITGPWDTPVVSKVQRGEVDVTPFRDCERYLAEVLSQLPEEAVP
jgi:uncharacterized protein (TIGR02099 family)